MSGENNEDNEPRASIASLKSRFETLATAGNASAGPSRPPAPRPTFTPKPAWTKPAPAVSSAAEVGGPREPLLGTSSSDIKLTNDPVVEDSNPPVASVRALRDRFATASSASPVLSPAPSRPRSRSPAKSNSPAPVDAEVLRSSPSTAESSQPATELLEPPSNFTIAADILSSSPAAEPAFPLKKKAPPPPPPISRSRSPAPGAILPGPPPQPDRSSKPIPSKTSPAYLPSEPASGSSSAPAPQPLPTVEARRPSAPALPTRKPTLPAGTSPELIGVPAPPPIPGNRPSVGRSPSARSTEQIPIESPPLPSRSRASTISAKAEAPATPPRLPVRAGTSAPVPKPQPSPSAPSLQSSREATPISDGTWQAPPPPTRNTLAAVSSPPRRQETRISSKSGAASSDEEEDEEEKEGGPALTATAKRMLEEYPDTTNANKRPPAYLPDIRLSGTHHIYSFAVFGRYVCLGAHHVRVFDVQMSDRPLFTVDLHHTGLEFRVKDPRVTAMCFRPALDEADEGRYLWCGTKDGHLWELDIKTGQVTDTRAFAHASSVSNIFRWKKHVMSLEENGKLHLYDLQQLHDSDVSRIPEVCRTVRVADRFTFARMLRHQLWTSTGPANRSTTNTAGSRGPTIRVYEPCAEGTMPPPATLYTTEWTGAVTSASVLPLKPEEVYLAHEGGYVSIWNAGDLTCLSVLKISGSDILSMEGVGRKLWLGNRKGQIGVYDVAQKPWLATNLWTGHHEQPVHHLCVDPWAIEHADRFTCWSIGRDTIHAWDGLLAVDWLDRKMEERQPDFCAFRDINVLVCTWNIDSAKPGDLSGSEANTGFLDDLMNSGDSPDVVVFGFQEVIPLTDKKLTAKTLLFGKDKGAPGALSDKVSMAYRQWQDKLQSGLRRGTQAGDGYIKVHSESLVGLLTCAFVKQSQQFSLRDLAITTVKRGIGGIYGNKGAIVARLVMDDTSICFINVHLAAGQKSKAARNADIAAIMEDKAIFPSQDPTPYVHGGDGTGIMDHEIVIINGDMNYRIDQRRDNVIASVYANEYAYLLEHDQLRKELRSNRGFRLRSFDEAPITFAPTYKYDRRSDEYDSSEKRRVPAWCDRILFTKSDKVECLNYRRYETDVSDHRPVSATLRIRLKAVNDEEMMKVKADLRKEWGQVEAELLGQLSRAFVDWERT